MTYQPQLPDDSLVRELARPISESSFWLKLLGVLSIISGVSLIFSLVGILVCWLPIWQGVLLFRAGSAATDAARNGVRYDLFKSLESLKTYFVLNGFLALLGILITVGAICFIVIAALSGATWLRDLEYYY
jgi:hypothetical protein